MNKKVEKEIEQLINTLKLVCTVEDFHHVVYWDDLLINHQVSEDFIREFCYTRWIIWTYVSRYQKLSESFIVEFQHKVCWYEISQHQVLSEDFIRKFQDKVDWVSISEFQILSEDFIREFQNVVSWDRISEHQELSEDFIREFRNDLNWYRISMNQKLSEEFIIEFKSWLYLFYIRSRQELSENFIKNSGIIMDFADVLKYQNLSDEFLAELGGKVDLTARKLSFFNKTLEQKKLEVEDYAKKYNLEYDDKYLYAFRNHSRHGRGSYNKAVFYKTGVYHKDWRCDLNPNNENSFGLGIWPSGNTPVKIKIEDWGVVVNNDDNGKARVWGFEII